MSTASGQCRFSGLFTGSLSPALATRSDAAAIRCAEKRPRRRASGRQSTRSSCTATSRSGACQCTERTANEPLSVPLGSSMTRVPPARTSARRQRTRSPLSLPARPTRPPVVSSSTRTSAAGQLRKICGLTRVAGSSPAVEASGVAFKTVSPGRSRSAACQCAVRRPGRFPTARPGSSSALPGRSRWQRPTPVVHRRRPRRR